MVYVPNPLMSATDKRVQNVRCTAREGKAVVGCVKSKKKKKRGDIGSKKTKVCMGQAGEGDCVLGREWVESAVLSDRISPKFFAITGQGFMLVSGS